MIICDLRLMYQLQYKGNLIGSAVWSDSSEFMFYEI